MSDADRKEVTIQAEPNGERTPSIEAEPVKKATSGQKLKRHFKKFWWIWLIVFVLVVLAIVLPIVYVWYPKQARKAVKKSTLTIVSQEYLDPTPTSVRVVQHDIVHSNSSYHPTISAFNASVYLPSVSNASSPFVYLEIPKLKSGKNANQYINDTASIANMEMMYAYCETVLGSSQYELGVKGNPKLKEGSLPSTRVTFDKTVTLTGLNGLEGLEITDFGLLTSTDSEGHNVNGTIMVPNPSKTTFDFGNVTTILYLPTSNSSIGTNLLPNFKLVPGNNTYSFLGKINTTRVISAFASTYTDGVFPLTIRGNSSINSKGQHLPYYEAALKKLELTNVTLDVSSALGSLTSIL